MEHVKYGLSSKQSTNFLHISKTVEQAFYPLMIFLSFLQYTTVHSEVGDYCVHKYGVLNLEGSWLNSLIMLQICKVIIFSFFDTFSISWDDDFSQQQMQQSQEPFSEDEESMGSIKKQLSTESVLSLGRRRLSEQWQNSRKLKLKLKQD